MKIKYSEREILMNNKELKIEFEEVCNYLFGWDDELKKLYKEVLVYNGNYDQYGGCDASIQLMKYIRKKLSELKLVAENTKDNFDDWKNNRGQFFTDNFLKLVLESEHIEPNEIKQYIEKDKLYSYECDQWKYENGEVHYYYNELDHYITHMVGNIIKKTGVRFDKEPGMQEIRECIKKKFLCTL